MATARREIAREGLLRTKPFALSDRASSDGGDGLTLEGHAAVFNSPTVIDSWEGRFREQTARGAFKKTFSERTPVLQFDHGRHPLIGSIPLGRINTAKEDQKGAYVKSRLADNWLIQPVRDAISNGSVDGMSFRFEVVQDEWRDADGNLVTDPNKILRAIYNSDGLPESQLMLRTLREVKVPELGPVVFPAYEATDVAVRSGGTTVIDLGSLRSDPDARKRLARTLWIAEQADVDDGDDQGGAEQERAAAANAELEAATDAITAIDAIRQVGQQIAEALAGLADLVAADHEKRTAQQMRATGGPAERDATTSNEPAAADGGHSKDTGRPADDGHRPAQDPAPAERHAGEHDEPPSDQGHSSDNTTPRMSRTGRRLALQAVLQQAEASQERTALFGHLFHDRDDAAADGADDDDSSKEN